MSLLALFLTLGLLCRLAPIQSRLLLWYVHAVLTNTVGRRAFTVQGPMVWNSLPDDFRAQQDYESFRQRLKTWLFSSY